MSVSLANISGEGGLGTLRGQALSLWCISDERRGGILRKRPHHGILGQHFAPMVSSESRFSTGALRMSFKVKIQVNFFRDRSVIRACETS